MPFTLPLHRGYYFKQAHIQPVDARLAMAWALAKRDPVTNSAADQTLLGEWECDHLPCRRSFKKRLDLRAHLLVNHEELHYD